MKVRPGDVIDVPYELTITTSFRDLWQAAFYCHDRINTSTPFARQLGLQEQVVPFGLILFLAGSMSHADQAKIQTGFKDAIYHWPAFIGDTFKKKFIIKSLRLTKNQESIFDIECIIHNQRGQKIFTTTKTMLFPYPCPPSEMTYDQSSYMKKDFLNHLTNQSEVLQTLGSKTISSVRPEQLIIHTLSRPLSQGHMMSLATLGRLTHERHFNTLKFNNDELYVPGALSLAMTLSLASRDLHEVLFEELIECSFPNHLSPDDIVGSVSYVASLQEHYSGDIECLTIRTIGIKKMDVPGELLGKGLPLDLFTSKIMKPSVLEDFLQKKCPQLSKRIVCIADRKIYRQAPKQTPFLL